MVFDLQIYYNIFKTASIMQMPVRNNNQPAGQLNGTRLFSFQSHMCHLVHVLYVVSCPYQEQKPSE